MFSRSMFSTTAPKSCFSLGVLVIGVIVKVGSGAKIPGAMSNVVSLSSYTAIDEAVNVCLEV